MLVTGTGDPAVKNKPLTTASTIAVLYSVIYVLKDRIGAKKILVNRITANG
jgi:hypothetical protein